jgi:hypothetical protein
MREARWRQRREHGTIELFEELATRLAVAAHRSPVEIDEQRFDLLVHLVE